MRLLLKFLKSLVKFLLYEYYRRKVFREIDIRKIQNEQIKLHHSSVTTNLIVFLVDGVNYKTGEDRISGGILSIASIYEETIKLKAIHKSEVIMMTIEQANLLRHHTQFDNNIPVFRFAQLINQFQELSNLMIHVPEFLTSYLVESIESNSQYFKKINKIHVNILNQNNDLMPKMDVIDKLRVNVSLLTQTTAHERYCNLQQAQTYNMPVHLLSVFASPEKYHRKCFAEKENIIALSPDLHPFRDEIIDKLTNQFPDFQIITIQNLRYEDYLRFISKVKFTLTFGEGLDFYFIETAFSGGIAMAVYNEKFFTDDFNDTPGVFKNYEDLCENCINWIKTHNSTLKYSLTNQQQANSCAKVYKYHDYINNLTNFYLQRYTYQ